MNGTIPYKLLFYLWKYEQCGGSCYIMVRVSSRNTILGFDIWCHASSFLGPNAN